MRRMILFAMGLACIAAGIGCATALNVQDASLRKPYGGVTMPITEFFGGSDSGEFAEYAAIMFWPWWLVDKPFSLVADTLTLPYLLAERRNNVSPPSRDNLQSTQTPQTSADQGSAITSK